MRCLKKEYIESNSKLYDLEIDGGNNNYIANGLVVHNTLCQIGIISNLPEDKREDCIQVGPNSWAYVTSKGLAKQGLVQKNTPDNMSNLYVQILNNLNDSGVLGKIAAWTYEGESVYLFGEIIGAGVQSGYSYSKKAPVFRIFDIYVKGPLERYLNYDELEKVSMHLGIQRVPCLYHGPYSYDKMVELRDGKTVEGEGSHIREGIVIRSFNEREYKGLPDNRAQVKFVSPDYLLKSSGEEVS